MNDIPYVEIGADEPTPWEHLNLDCPKCGEGPLPLLNSDPPRFQYISHCDRVWLRGQLIR